MTREQVEAIAWLNNAPISERICDLDEDTQWYGFYRVLDNGKYDFQSFCGEEAEDYLAFKREDLEALLGITIPREGK